MHSLLSPLLTWPCAWVIVSIDHLMARLKSLMQAVMMSLLITMFLVLMSLWLIASVWRWAKPIVQYVCKCVCVCVSVSVCVCVCVCVHKFKHKCISAVLLCSIIVTHFVQTTMHIHDSSTLSLIWMGLNIHSYLC